ncbi:pyridoxal-phosphate dependent enzyme [Fusibacter tunisiensis]|uniref:Threonine synthase n=1 Tax=Fusibacter tunisiensis TaxID=1008308 RepID=A0ABS2MTU0_9FIRM|nr:threonine synthase [Fusibacter tunisiensis]
MNYICSKCGLKEDVFTHKSKCACGGLWKLDFVPPKFDLGLVDHTTWGMFRYRAFMPLLDDSWKSVTLGEGLTPIIKLNEAVMLKMDYFMPTLSFKDRGAAMLISHCKSIGIDSVVQDSSGNAGNSVAAYCAKAGISCEIFVPEGTSVKKIDMIKVNGAKATIVQGSRDYCADVCRKKVEEDSIYYANHVYNPFFYEGTKTYIYEVYEQLNRIPSNLIVPIGNGTLFIGILKGLEELLRSGAIEKMPQIIGVQSQNCNPLVKALASHNKFPVPVTPTHTLAEGIAIGRPMRGEEILAYVYQYDIDLISVSEDGILEAREKLSRKGIYCEPTTAANYAAYLKYSEINGKLLDCLIPMCGSGLKK